MRYHGLKFDILLLICTQIISLLIHNYGSDCHVIPCASFTIGRDINRNSSRWKLLNILTCLRFLKSPVDMSEIYLIGIARKNRYSYQSVFNWSHMRSPNVKRLNSCHGVPEWIFYRIRWVGDPVIDHSPAYTDGNGSIPGRRVVKRHESMLLPSWSLGWQPNSEKFNCH